MTPTAAHHALLAETIARHFEGARVKTTEIELGIADVLMRCHVHALSETQGHVTAHLLLDLRGGELGNDPVALAASGHADNAEDAIRAGASEWATAFAPLLRASLGGDPGTTHFFDVEVHGQVFHAFVEGLDRALVDASDPPGTDVSPRTAAARTRFGASPWLTRVLLESGRLPVLPPKGASVIGLFVFDGPDQRLVDVRVNGRAWPGADRAFTKVPPDPHDHSTMLRELCVLIPMGEPPPISREALSSTLAGLAVPADDHPRDAVAWPGWRAHMGELAPPISEAALAAFEAEIGVTLPADYAVFLTQLSGGGAGPGYGIYSPLSDAQKAIARGELSWTDGAPSGTPPRGALALAHAGCGNMWIMSLRGASAGEIWLDGAGSDGKVRRVAGSFEDWYREWLDTAVRDVRPFYQWNAQFCMARTTFAQMLAAAPAVGLDEAPRLRGVPNGALAITATESAYFAAGAIVDPCQACVSLATKLGLDSAVFKPGVPPRQAGDPRRLLDKLFKR